MLADASLRQGLLDESIKHAERALELGHGQAVIIQPLLAQALRLHGDNERAIQVLQAYLLDNVADGAAAKQLENLRFPSNLPVNLRPAQLLHCRLSRLWQPQLS